MWRASWPGPPIAVVRVLWKLRKARQVLLAQWRKDRPRAVIATGGYGSAPAAMAARSLGIPYFLHESNAQPGLVVKHLSRGARRVWCGMEAVERRLGGASCLTVGHARAHGLPARVQACGRPGTSLPASWCWGGAGVPGP